MPKAAGGVGFLPLMAIEKYQLIEKHAKAARMDNLSVRWIDVAPTAQPEAWVSGSEDFLAGGPVAFLRLWDKTLGGSDVKGIAAMSAVPMYLNTRAEHLKVLNDIRVDDRIAVPAAKVSTPAILMQMYAAERYRISDAPHFDPFTAAMNDANGVIALLSGANAVNAHFTSPPFHQRERRDPSVRTILTSDEVLGGPSTLTMISTSAGFRERNPTVYACVFEALKEAEQMVSSDKQLAAKLLLDSMNGSGFTVNELEQILKDPAIRFTTTPENIMKYANFMHQIGSIKNQPASWKDLFFPEIRGLRGASPVS